MGYTSEDIPIGIYGIYNCFISTYTHTHVRVYEFSSAARSLEAKTAAAVRARA